MYNENEVEGSDDLLWRSHSGRKVRGIKHGDIQWERTMCLRGKLQGTEVKQGFTQSVSVLEAEAVGVSVSIAS
jgi:hypothetical protein